MNQFALLAVLIAIVFIFWNVTRNSKSTGATKISPAEAKKRLDTEKDIILVDVRTESEYVEKHIPKSILIPVNTIEANAGGRLPDKNAHIFVYCRSGSRSAKAVNTLLKLGYTNIYNMGGITSWPYETVAGNRQEGAH